MLSANDLPDEARLAALKHDEAVRRALDQASSGSTGWCAGPHRPYALTSSSPSTRAAPAFSRPAIAQSVSASGAMPM